MKNARHHIEPAPCVCIRLDAQGNIIAQDTIVRDVIKPRRQYEGDTQIRYTHRVMAIQETGEDLFVAYATSASDGERTAEAAERDHPEWRQVYVERLPLADYADAIEAYSN